MIEALTPQRTWRAITLATLVLVPAFWSLVAGLVAVASDDAQGGPAPASAIVFGLALLPVAFGVLAIASGRPEPRAAVARAAGVSLLVGFPVSAIAADAVTGIVAGVGAGGICVLRAGASHNRRARALAIVVASVYTFVLARTAGALVLVSAPVFPFTALGAADLLSERRREREAVHSRA